MSGRYTTKVFIVQRASGEVIGSKLTFIAAHRLAKKEAPCQVIFSIADKTEEPNVPTVASD
jgi:hypothetical protein